MITTCFQARLLQTCAYKPLFGFLDGDDLYLPALLCVCFVVISIGCLVSACVYRKRRRYSTIFYSLINNSCPKPNPLACHQSLWREPKNDRLFADCANHHTRSLANRSQQKMPVDLINDWKSLRFFSGHIFLTFHN